MLDLLVTVASRRHRPATAAQRLRELGQARALFGLVTPAALHERNQRRGAPRLRKRQIRPPLGERIVLQSPQNVCVSERNKTITHGSRDHGITE